MKTETPATASYSFFFGAYVGTPAQLAETLRTEAREQTKAWPQYGGAYFDGWKLGRLTRDIKTKLGAAGRKGDLVIFREDTLPGPDGDEAVRTFWSRTNACATSVSILSVVAADGRSVRL